MNSTKKTGKAELNLNIESSKYFCDLVGMSDKKRLRSLPFELVTGEGKKWREVGRIGAKSSFRAAIQQSPSSKGNPFTTDVLSHTDRSGVCT